MSDATLAVILKKLHADFEKAMAKDDLNAALEINWEIVKALGIDLPPVYLKKDWAKKHGLKQSHAGGDPVVWLRGKRQPWCDLHWFDHGTRWTMAGLPYCLVGQPYGLGPEGIRELEALQLAGLEVWVSAYPAWHLPGNVLHVEVRRAGA